MILASAGLVWPERSNFLADQPEVIAFVTELDAEAVKFDFVELGGHGTNWRPIFLTRAG